MLFRSDAFTIILAVAVFACFVTLSLLAVSFSSVFYILICGVLGLALYFIRTIREKKGAAEEKAIEDCSAPAQEKAEGSTDVDKAQNDEQGRAER